MASPSLDELVLMPEVDARRALAAQSVVLRVLAPVGHYAGCGTLRVLRIRPQEEHIEMVCGYEAYDRLSA
ncbi:MAG TPA: hypothetical protein VJP85_12970 [Candidatus Baltobacteraceae bacterium]|nr:hypothetical protein [Candidatus Baltobacteraceae bacterium]